MTTIVVEASKVIIEYMGTGESPATPTCERGRAAVMAFSDKSVTIVCLFISRHASRRHIDSQILVGLTRLFGVAIFRSRIFGLGTFEELIICCW